MAPLGKTRSPYHFDGKLTRKPPAPDADRSRQTSGANWWLWQWVRLWRGRRNV